MNSKLFICALLCLTLSGCSKFFDKFSRLSPGMSTVRFSDGKKKRAGAGPTLSGGLMIYASRTDGVTQTILLSDDDDDTPHALPNGVWKFFAVGYPTAPAATPQPDNMSEPPRCGESEGTFDLAGGATQTVALSLTTEACSTDVFSEADFTTGSSVDPVELVFCDHATDASGFTSTGEACGDGKQSPSFNNGPPPPIGKAEHVNFDPISDRFVYIADTYGFKELFSSDSSGKNVIRQNTHFVNTTSRNVSDYEVVFDNDTLTSTGKAVYLSDDEYENSGVYQLYITEIGTQGGTRISPTLSSGLSVGGGIQRYKISKDGKYVVFAARTSNAGPLELYVVDLEATALDDTSAKKLSHDGIAGNGIQIPTAGADWDFHILPDSEHVVFAGRFTHPSQAELFHVPIADKIADETDDLLISKISHSGGFDTSYAVKELRLSFDGATLFWKGNLCTDFPTCASTKVLIYATDLSDPASPDSPLLISQNTTGPAEPTSGVLSGFWVSQTTNHLAFVGDIDTATQNELWIINFDDLANLTSNKVDSDPTFGFHFVNFSPNGSSVVYLKGNSNISFPNDKKLFAVSSNGSTTAENLTPNMTQGFDLANAGGGDTSPPFKIIDENRVLYIGDVSAAATPNTVPTLRMSTIDGLYQEESLIGSPTNTGAITKSYDFGYDHVFFTMDATTPGQYEAYRRNIGSDPDSDPSIYDPPVALTTIGSMVSTESVNVPPPQFQSIFGGSNPIFLNARRIAPSGPIDAYFVSDFNDPFLDTPVKLSHVDGGPQGSGSYRVSLMGYDLAGNETQSITSQCFSKLTADGTATTKGLRIPSGNIGTYNPFKVKVEIFANADGEDCSGTPVQVTLSSGLANYMSGDTQIKMVNTSSESNLFLSF